MEKCTMFQENNPRSLERYSSAMTLSDMEVFIFPELLYALVLANIMSPAALEMAQRPLVQRTGKADAVAPRTPAEAVHHGPFLLQSRP